MAAVLLLAMAVMVVVVVVVVVVVAGRVAASRHQHSRGSPHGFHSSTASWRPGCGTERPAVVVAVAGVVLVGEGAAAIVGLPGHVPFPGRRALGRRLLLR